MRCISFVWVLTVLIVAGTAYAQLQPHAVDFNTSGTGSGVSDGRLRFAMNAYPVLGEDYFIDNVSLTGGGGELVVNGDFSAGEPKPVFGFGSGQSIISFGNDASTTQLFERDLVLPVAGSACTLTFDACSTTGNNLDLKLIRRLDEKGKPS